MPILKSIIEVWVFHCLSSLFKGFIQNFIVDAYNIRPMRRTFKHINKARQDFELLKLRMWLTPILKLLDSYAFWSWCDTSGKRIGVVLIQEGHPIAYISEKLSGIKLMFYIQYGVLCHGKGLRSLVTLSTSSMICLTFQTWKLVFHLRQHNHTC